ncbi:hypothetical protein EQG49_02695 [Periweissella cryptocerci]|uniref:Uncharacterized protein n=1 Tax=Periweissella cryptocerci TaxID=2506420 RepID=A0A4P6YS49_9LACO|nr:hypothetical protein [Periweissella cryptocerci]QBO35450.1 hypothetical protein EQG49_02695 [Periweissella cryptocerci]
MEMIAQIAPLLMNLSVEDLLEGLTGFSVKPVDTDLAKGELVCRLVDLYCNSEALQDELLEWASTRQTLRPFEVEDILGIDKDMRKALTSTGILPVARKVPMRLYGREIMVPQFDYAEIFKLKNDAEFQATLLAEKNAEESVAGTE